MLREFNMVPLLILTFSLFIAGNSVADRISGGYHVDWEAEQQSLYQAYQDYRYPFEQPGELMPGLTVQGIISALGKTWHETEMREVFGLFCRDIAPKLTVAVPFISDICQPVFDSLNTNTFIDGKGICNAIYSYLGAPIPALRRRRRRMSPDGSLTEDIWNFNFEKVGHDINSQIFHLYSYDHESVCNAFNEFVNSEISTQRLIHDAGKILLEEAIAQGSLICQHWDQIYEGLRQADEQLTDEGLIPNYYHTLMTEASRLVADFSGFDSREALCDALVQASPPADNYYDYNAEYDPSVISSLADHILWHAFDTLTNADPCTQLATDGINMIIAFSPFIDYNQYVQMIFGLPSVGEACAYVDAAFGFDGCYAEPDTCANGGYCQDFYDIFTSSFRCTCPYGYAGSDCGIEVQYE